MTQALLVLAVLALALPFAAAADDGAGCARLCFRSDAQLDTSQVQDRRGQVQARCFTVGGVPYCNWEERPTGRKRR